MGSNQKCLSCVTKHTGQLLHQIHSSSFELFKEVAQRIFSSSERERRKRKKRRHGWSQIAMKRKQANACLRGNN